MKIYNEVIIDMNTGETIYEDSFDYNGDDIALCCSPYMGGTVGTGGWEGFMNMDPPEQEPSWEPLTADEAGPEFKSMVGDFRFDESAPFGTAGKLYSKDSAQWDPEGIFGPSGLDSYKNKWAYPESVTSSIFKDNVNYLENVFSDTVTGIDDPWAGLAFKGGYSTEGGWETIAKQAMTNYKGKVGGIFDDYYGSNRGDVWMSSTSLRDWIPSQDAQWLGSSPSYGWDWTGAGRDESVLGRYYKDWAGYTNISPTAYDVTGATTEDPTDSVYHQLQAGTLSAPASAGDRVTKYFQDRQAAVTPFFGTETDALAGWDPTDPHNIAPMIDVDGTLEELTIDSEAADFETAKLKYSPGSAMFAHIEAMEGTKSRRDAKQIAIDIKGQDILDKKGALDKWGIDSDPESATYGKFVTTDDAGVKTEVTGSAREGEQWEAFYSGQKEFSPIESGKYAGLYEGQETILKGLFGEGDYVEPGLGSPLATARENISTVAENFYVNPNFGENALSTAIAKTSDDDAAAALAWNTAMEGASQSFFGIGDYNKDDLITMGFMDDDYNLLYDPTANSANESSTWNNIPSVKHDDALEQESELAYQIRNRMGGENEEGAIGTYQNTYDQYVDDKVENLEQAHLDFQTDFESAASEFAQGQVGLKEKVAKQKGLRSGTTARVKEKLEQGIADVYGEDKLTWEDFNVNEKKNFDNNIEIISNNLVTAWDMGFGDAGTLDQQEGIMDTSLGNIFGTYTYTPTGATAAITVPHTAETILEVMQNGFVAGGTQSITIDGVLTNITTNTKGDYGTAFDTHKTTKLGLFGKTDPALLSGYSPGPDKKFGTADDETFVGAGNVTAGKLPSYTSVDTGWETGAIAKELYAGVDLPTAVTADMEAYPTGGIFGTGLRDWVGTFTGDLGAATTTEAGLLSEAEITALETAGSATEVAKYTGVTEGKFGDVSTDVAEDLATYNLGLAGLEDQAAGALTDLKTAIGQKGIMQSEKETIEGEPIQSLQSKFFTGPGNVEETFGPSPVGEAAKIEAFAQDYTDDQNATISEWQNMWKTTGEDTIAGQVASLRNSVTGVARNYLEFVQGELQDEANIFHKLFAQDYTGFDPVTGLERADDDPPPAGFCAWCVVEGVVVAAAVFCANPANWVLCFSDRKLKKNIKKVSTHKGLNVYTFSYLWDDKKHTGFMADEVEKVVPEAVIKNGNYKMVNYFKVLRSL